MYLTDSYPTQWKESYIHFINKSDGKNVRPIALTSCICKLFESIIKNKLQWWIEVKNILPKSQTGFRKGQSTTDNLSNLILNVDEGFRKKRDTLAAFLDVKGAFDNVNIQILLEKLASIGCPSNIIKFVKFITFERIIHTVSLSRDYRLVYKGVPQGGVLSPLLYNIYVSQITDNLPKSIVISQFADDIAIYCNKFNDQKSKKILEKTISTVHDNLYELGLELSPEKTVFIQFTKKKKPSRPSEIKIKNSSVKASDKVRFLGVILDYKLTFKQQTEEICKRTHKAMNIIKYLRGTWWGSVPQTLLIFYKSYIRSIIDYASYIYLPRSTVLIEKLEKIQYMAIRLALGYRISTPINVLIAESKMLFIEDRAKSLCYNYINKIISNKELLIHDTLIRTSKNIDNIHNINNSRLLIQCIKSIKYTFPQIISRNKYTTYAYDYHTHTSNIDVNTDFGLSIKKNKDPNEQIKNLIEKENAYAIYTDGSKSEYSNSVGCACILANSNTTIMKSINKQASVTTAESIAINCAVDHALTLTNKNVIIFSDSLSVLTSLKNAKFNIKTNPYILEIRKKTLEFNAKTLNNSNIKFYWIPAHRGILGNETADTKAKEAANLAPNSSLKIPFYDFRTLNKDLAKTETK